MGERLKRVGKAVGFVVAVGAAVYVGSETVEYVTEANPYWRGCYWSWEKAQWMGPHC